jgi:hypothetical protein
MVGVYFNFYYSDWIVEFKIMGNVVVGDNKNVKTDSFWVDIDRVYKYDCHWTNVEPLY